MSTESLEKKKRRADEALAFFESLDEETRKAVYIASSILVAVKETEQGREEKAS